MIKVDLCLGEAMKHFMILCCLLTSSLPLFGQQIFDMPQLFPRHKQYLRQFVTAFQGDNLIEAEIACRAATILFPDDINWAYNLACSLARQNKVDDAFAQLEKAINMGQHDLNQLKTDTDLNSLRMDPRFAKLLSLAQTKQNAPRSGSSLQIAIPTHIQPGQEAFVTMSNTTWDWTPSGSGHFLSSFIFDSYPTFKGGYNGPYAELINAWLKDNTAAGNTGELYVNRDEDTAVINYDNFPGLTPIMYDENAVAKRIHVGIGNAIFSGSGTTLPVIANTTYAINQPPYWRSFPRLIQADSNAITTAFRLAIANQLYIYHASRDVDVTFLGDILIANNPSYMITTGSPANQIAFTEALFATLAAMRPAVKKEMMRRGIMIQTLQRLVRKSIRNADYLSPAAHPVAFDYTTIDVEALIKRAHNLTIPTLPAIVQLVTRQERMPVHNKDYFDAYASEGIADLPTCISRVIRGKDYTKRISIEAVSPVAGMKYHWFPVHADLSKVRINPLTSSKSLVTLEVDYHGLYTNVVQSVAMPMRRVDIACIGELNGVYSAPSFVSLRYLTNEKRIYDKDNKILSIDYRMPEKIYEDPLISAFKDWKDSYNYTPQGTLTGWTRQQAGQPDRVFNAQGKPVDGKPVKYMPNEQPQNPMRPLTLIQQD